MTTDRVPTAQERREADEAIETLRFGRFAMFERRVAAAQKRKGRNRIHSRTDQTGKAAGTMTTAKHTPGPWEIVGPYFDIYQAGTSEYICQSSKSQGARRAANARLITEAPEMETAIRDAVSASDANDGDSLMNAIENFRAILTRIDKDTDNAKLS